MQNLPHDCTEAELKELLAPYGTVRECVFISKKIDVKSSSRAIVRVSAFHEAVAIKKAMNRTEYKGRTLSFKW